ncbi:unnamed protein product [Caenorhabditis sp. 36 PRJEB53466]|nr:unnamed protein product [Caenorhabditis sp. 36 PRJEB53466]
MAKKKLTEEELLIAFDRYMPKRHVYPPLVEDGDVLSNANTESEGSDDEKVEVTDQMVLFMEFAASMTPECKKAWQGFQCKLPEKYVTDNVRMVLESALNKLINLKTKPKNPIEWLGFQLLNMNVQRESHQKRRKTSGDHLVKPMGDQRDFTLNLFMEILDYSESREPVIPMFHLPVDSVIKRAPPAPKRKHPTTS